MYTVGTGLDITYQAWSPTLLLDHLVSDLLDRPLTCRGGSAILVRVDRDDTPPGEPPVSPPIVGPHLREQLDVVLFVRRLLGSAGFRVTRFLPRRKLTLPKDYWVHAVVLLIVGGVVAANAFASAADRGSLLFALFGESEIEEGPLAPPADGARRTQALLGLIPTAAAGGVSEEDLEFELANILGGTALVATGSPETAEASTVRRSGVVAHHVQDGDTPASIAARFGVSTNTVLWANGIRDGDIIRPGDVLVILPVSGVLHTVRSGDDVTSLAERYDAAVEGIIARNGLADDGAIRIGQKLVIPDGQIRLRPRRLAAHEEEVEGAEELVEAPTPSPVRAAGPGLLWPTVSRKISQYFGWRHTGIDIPNRSRPPVYAADEGTVEFAGWLGGYGRLVILRHGKGLTTYYAHLGKTLVAKGQAVSRGDALGVMGCTGRCSGPHVHFEARVGGRPVNPLRYF